MPQQDSFEDASETSPRPDSPSGKSQSRSRSLLQKETPSSTVQEVKTDPTARAAPTAAPKDSKDDSDESEEEDESDGSDESDETDESGTGSEAEEPEKPINDAPVKKPPLPNRVSVTSDMDDVSLDGGAYFLSV